MVVRKRKRVNRMLGSRTRGNGDTKNRRGAGSRGGRGLAGSHKHKYAKYHEKFGKEKKQVIGKETKAINIDQLMQAIPRLEAEGKVAREKGILVVDGEKIGYGKLLSNGTLKEKLLVKNMKASKKAVKKTEEAGGSVEAGEEKEEQPEAAGAEQKEKKAGEKSPEAKPAGEKNEKAKEKGPEPKAGAK